MTDSAESQLAGAIARYAAGELTLAAAANAAGVSIDKLLEAAAKRGISAFRGDVTTFAEDLDRASRFYAARKARLSAGTESPSARSDEIALRKPPRDVQSDAQPSDRIAEEEWMSRPSLGERRQRFTTTRTDDELHGSDTRPDSVPRVDAAEPPWYVRCSRCSWLYYAAAPSEAEAVTNCWHCGTPARYFVHADASEVPVGAAISPARIPNLD